MEGRNVLFFSSFFKGNGGVGGHKREWETPDGGKCFEEEGPRMAPGAFFSFLLSTSYILVLRERGEGKGAKNDTLMPAEFLWEMDGRRRIEMLRQTPLLEMRQWLSNRKKKEKTQNKQFMLKKKREKESTRGTMGKRNKTGLFLGPEMKTQIWPTVRWMNGRGIDHVSLLTVFSYYSSSL